MVGVLFLNRQLRVYLGIGYGVKFSVVYNGGCDVQ